MTDLIDMDTVISKNCELKVGDYVFATVRGYPSWPARINKVEINNKSIYYRVTFFATNETARCSKKNVHEYQKNKHILGVTKKK